jgi:hypothetical protein
MLLLAVIPRTPNTVELLNSLYSNAGLSGFGLLLTAIVQTIMKQLSLFDALFVFHILFFLGTGASPMGKYHWTKSRVALAVLVQFLSITAFTAWGLYLWFKVKDYGIHHECNDQIKYVVFFVSVKATEPWLRWLWVVVLILSAVGLMIMFGKKAFELLAMVGEEEQAEGPRPWSFFMPFGLLFTAIYATIMLELTVRRNMTAAHGVVKVDDSWAFGQVLSFVMIFANINEAIHFLFGYFGRRRVRLASERQPQMEESAAQLEEHAAPSPYRARGPSGSTVSTRDQLANSLSSGYELRDLLDRRNAERSETTVASSLQPQHQPVDTLR